MRSITALLQICLVFVACQHLDPSGVLEEWKTVAALRCGIVCMVSIV